MYRSRTLSWLREDANPLNQPWKTWSVPIESRPNQEIRWRDLVIIDENGEFFAVQNLSSESLSSGANRNKLVSALLSAATVTDTDIDGLPDRWEFTHFGNIESGADTKTKSGLPAIVAYATAQDPNQYSPSQNPEFALMTIAERRYMTISFRRRLGGEGDRLTYMPEVTSDGMTWDGEPTAWEEVSSANPWDGTGTEMVTLRLLNPIGTERLQLARLRVESPL